MISIPQIREKVGGIVYETMGVPIVPENEDAPRPPKPFITHNVSGGFRSPHRRDSKTEQELLDGVRITSVKAAELTLSFSAYAKDEDEAATLAAELAELFDRTARQTLKESGIVVVSTADMSNRSLMLGDHMESRWGLDVIIRVANLSVTDVDYIATYSITRKDGPDEG